VNFFCDANRYNSIFKEKAGKKPKISNMWLATWRDEEGYTRHDLLYDATTNNQAEYGSMLFVLRHIYKQRINQVLGINPWLEEVVIHGDSQLMIYQMLGKYQVKDGDLKPLWLEAINLVINLKHMGVEVRFVWIPRELNNEALGITSKILPPPDTLGDLLEALGDSNAQG